MNLHKFLINIKWKCFTELWPYEQNLFCIINFHTVTAWKVPKYGVFSGPYFPVIGPEKTPYLDTFHAQVLINLGLMFPFYTNCKQQEARDFDQKWIKLK